LNNDLVGRGYAEEGHKGIKAVIDNVEDGVRDVPTTAEVAEGKAEDEGQGVQGSSEKSVAECTA
jgi:hypothetical protein